MDADDIEGDKEVIFLGKCISEMEMPVVVAVIPMPSPKASEVHHITISRLAMALGVVAGVGRRR
jgi:hypothetical protein